MFAWKQGTHPAHTHVVAHIIPELQENFVLLQVMVLTHEKACFEERCPYLAAKWYPMPILNIYGRCARLEPEIRTDVAVYYGWRDHILPLMLSPKFPPDTLFLVVEEDWRINEEDGEVSIHDLLRRTSGGVSPSPDAGASASSTDRGIWTPVANIRQVSDPFGLFEESQPWTVDAEGSHRHEGEMGAAAEPVAAEDEEYEALARVWKPKSGSIKFPQTLRDVVRICTVAHRANVGDLVWLAWEPSERKAHPGHGTTALGMTKSAAVVLTPWIRQLHTVFHMDVVLRDALIANNWETT